MLWFSVQVRAGPPFSTMAWVYILRGPTGRHYIGSSTNLESRLEQHRKGQAHSTRRFGLPLELAASLEMISLEEA